MYTTALRILVTGGSGFIGTHLCRYLTQQGHYVQVIDLKKPSSIVPNVAYFQGDVRIRDNILPLIENADVVFHLAATVSVPMCQLDPVESYSNNFSATVFILSLIKETMDKQNRTIRMGFASTAAIYGRKGDDGKALTENDAAQEFLSYYAAQKSASEQALYLYTHAEKVPTLAFRFFNVYGPGQDPDSPYSGVISVFTVLAKAGKTLPLNAGGSQTRDFISVYDLVVGITSSLNLPKSAWNGDAINLGTGKATSIRELAEIICNIAKSSSQISHAPARTGDVMHSKADISRAQKILNFDPKFDLTDSLKRLL